MNFIADFHIHSPFSRATSKLGDLFGLYSWARIKGIQVVGTGDFTHPAWVTHLKEYLEEAEPGLYKLKDAAAIRASEGHGSQTKPVRFILSSEISCIYKKAGKTRKIHVVLLVPDLAAVERLNARLATIGNLTADGRPILGLDVKHLLEILLEVAPEGIMIPAHIWTPWFSLFGSKSGFDTFEDCFEDLSDQIFALETGLSSDPEMIRRISALDRFTLVSNSDSHSPSKLGREANLFSTDLNYFAIKQALINPSKYGFKGTIEFYPEEGKYHLDGHRKCYVCLSPEESHRFNGICPVCSKPLTIGVMHRVLELADRDLPVYPQGQQNFISLIPLPEVLSELLGVGAGSKTVQKEYFRVIDLFESEFNLFLETPLDQIVDAHSPLLGEAVRRIRNSEVVRISGYDGEYGNISLFASGEMKQFC